MISGNGGATREAKEFFREGIPNLRGMRYSSRAMPLRIFLIFLALGSLLRAATPDETARFLAGLPLQGTSLESLSAAPFWAKHAVRFDAAWKELDKRQISKIKAWAPENLAPAYEGHGNVFYFFSGPDQLYASLLFPNAANYVLVAREPVGILPEPDKIPVAQLAPSLENLYSTLNASLSFSFFITKKMKDDLKHQQLSGTTPVIMVFLARGGYKIESVDFIGLDAAGAVTADAKPASRGVKIVVTGASGEKQNVYYFEADLGDWVLKKNDAVLKFCDSLGRGSSLVKAASYLMHGGGFDIVRNYIEKNSDLVIEDDSGIPLHYFDKKEWDLKFYGHYSGPIGLFKKSFQADVAAAYKETAPGPLPFSFGYNWRPNTSGALIARKKANP